MNKKESLFLGAACFFGGMVAGFMIAPIKKGIYCGNNNGNPNFINTSDENKVEKEELTDLNKKIEEVISEI